MLKLPKVIRSEMNIQKVNLSSIINEIANYLQNLEANRKVEFIIKEEIIVQADKRLLIIAMENLLENAWKFTSKKTKAVIKFDVLQQKNRPVYFIRDNGAGLHMNYVYKLFRAFQRLHDSKEFTGKGIGLATVQRIILRHGGKAWAEGEVGNGAIFFLHCFKYCNLINIIALRINCPNL